MKLHTFLLYKPNDELTPPPSLHIYTVNLCWFSSFNVSNLMEKSIRPQALEIMENHTKKSMLGKIMEFEKTWIIMEKSWNFVK